MDKFKELFTESKIHNNDIFYHMFCVNDALDRFLRTYSKIQLSGLINKIDFIYINCVGKNKHIYSQKIHKLPKVNINIGNHDRDESETLNILRRFCINNIDGNVLYLHSKGSSKPNCKYRKLCKECMEYFLVEEHKKCLKILETHDNCGVNLQESFYLYHRDIFGKGGVRIPIQQNNQHVASWYCGNFWWATNRYISKLDKCAADSRFDSEVRFLFPSRSKFHNLYNPPGPFYKTLVYRKLYTEKESLI
jgi:hypothetical protein